MKTTTPPPSPSSKRRGLIKVSSMTNFQELKKKMLKDPKFKKYYDELGPEFAIIRAKIRKQIKKEKVAKALDAKLKISIQ